MRRSALHAGVVRLACRGLAALAFATAVAAGAAGPPVTLPVRVHLEDALELRKAGVTMRGWVTRADLERDVLPEVNRIWAPAGIRFELAGVEPAVLRMTPKREKWLKRIAGATRDVYGRSDPARIRALGKLVDFGSPSPGVIDVWLVPYLGGKSQGHTKRRARRIVLGQWSDKGFGKGRPPERVYLVEPPPFERGSLGRTLAHELGHVLRLKHPDKASQRETGLLMGGRDPGYRLTSAEIDTARREAQVLAQALGQGD